MMFLIQELKYMAVGEQARAKEAQEAIELAEKKKRKTSSVSGRSSKVKPSAAKIKISNPMISGQSGPLTDVSAAGQSGQISH